MNKPVVLFDGVCVLCSSLIRILFKIDSRMVLYFSTLQSDYAKESFEKLGLEKPPQNTVVLIYNLRLYLKSDAILEVSRVLGFPYSLAFAAKLIPPMTRNAIYDWIASRRYAWFGVRERCFIPRPEERARFLDLTPPTTSNEEPEHSV